MSQLPRELQKLILLDAEGNLIIPVGLVRLVSKACLAFVDTGIIKIGLTLQRLRSARAIPFLSKLVNLREFEVHGTSALDTSQLWDGLRRIRSAIPQLNSLTVIFDDNGGSLCMEDASEFVGMQPVTKEFKFAVVRGDLTRRRSRDVARTRSGGVQIMMFQHTPTVDMISFTWAF